jgi:hypothetical protein
MKQKRAIRLGRIALKDNAKVGLHQPCLLQRLECTVFGDRLERAGSELDRQKAMKFGYPDPASFKVRREKPWSIGGHVLADATFFLCHTAPMDYVTLYRLGTGDAAFSRHCEFSWSRVGKIRTFTMNVKANFIWSIGEDSLQALSCPRGTTEVC